MGYSKLFWGFIFLFDFRIGGFDLLPDFIGYILFYQGLSALEYQNDLFKKGKGFALPLIFLSILDIYQVTYSIDGTGVTLSSFSLVFGTAFTVINLLMVYNICYGIKSEAEKMGISNLISEADTVWKVYLVTNIVLGLSLYLIGIMGIMLIFTMILSIVSYLWMLKFTKTASNQLA